MSMVTRPVVGAVQEYQTDGRMGNCSPLKSSPAAWSASPGSTLAPESAEVGASVTGAGDPLKTNAFAKSSLAGGTNTATRKSNATSASPGPSTAIEYVVPAT